MHILKKETVTYTKQYGGISLGEATEEITTNVIIDSVVSYQDKTVVIWVYQHEDGNTSFGGRVETVIEDGITIMEAAYNSLLLSPGFEESVLVP